MRTRRGRRSGGPPPARRARRSARAVATSAVPARRALARARPVRRDRGRRGCQRALADRAGARPGQGPDARSRRGVPGRARRHAGDPVWRPQHPPPRAGRRRDRQLRPRQRRAASPGARGALGPRRTSARLRLAARPRLGRRLPQPAWLRRAGSELDLPRGSGRLAARPCAPPRPATRGERLRARLAARRAQRPFRAGVRPGRRRRADRMTAPVGAGASRRPLYGYSPGMEAEITVESVKAVESRSGNTRYVLRDDEGREYTTFRPKIGKDAAGYEGRRARITFHEEERNGFHNVYLDAIESAPAMEAGGADTDAEEAAWTAAVEAAPWLLGAEETEREGAEREPAREGPREELYERLEPFKSLVARDIREHGDDAEDDDVQRD